MKKITKTAKKNTTAKLSTSALILKFAAKTGSKTFSTSQLRNYVSQKSETAPGTTDRVLRQMRQANRINYEVTNRALGRYRFTEVSA